MSFGRYSLPKNLLRGNGMEIVRCPKCHKRLFDMSDDLIGTISIQCRRCKTVVVFSFPSLHVQPEPIAGP